MKNDFKIIYQDSDILVIEKSAGLVVESEKKGDKTLETILKNDFKINLPRSGIVHRLDRDTSGLMVIAKTKEAQVSLQNQFASHEVKKIYTALVFGKLEPRKGTVNIALKRDTKNRTRFVVSKSKEAKRAVTHYEVGGYLTRVALRLRPSPNRRGPHDEVGKGEVVSLLRINIETGRTHQIRAHFFAIGFPVVGDQVYKSRDSEIFSKKIGLKRQFLHATELEFKHPVTKKKLNFKLELPKDLRDILE